MPEPLAIKVEGLNGSLWPAKSLSGTRRTLMPVAVLPVAK
jgi:hypothetical protein